MLSASDNQVAVFIDYENIEISLQSKVGKEKGVDVDWSRVLDAAVELGRVVIRKAYADWATFSASQRDLLGLGIDLVHVTAKRGKNAADIRIVIDALEMLFGERINISHVMLVSGDGDFTELVHRLRAHGKFVVGMGISGASAEYLIKACDQFIFYDILVGIDKQVTSDDDRETTAVAFDISEARQLLRRAMGSRQGEWIGGGRVKGAMLRLDPSFSERNYNFDNFKEFLASQSDLVRLRTPEGGHLEVQMILEEDETGAEQAPEALLDKYLAILARQRVIMTPTEHRPAIIVKFFEIYRDNPGRSLTAHKEELHTYYEETAPQIRWQYIHEVIHQLFRSFCFEFDQDDSKYPQDVRLWDREVTLAAGLESSIDLLDRCDRGLLQRVRRMLGPKEKLDTEVAARLLYGSVRGSKMLNHVKQLIDTLD